MKEIRIVKSFTIFPYGRDGGKVPAKVVTDASEVLLASLGLPANLEYSIHNTCGRAYQLTPECTLLLASEGDSVSVLIANNANPRVVLAGKLDGGTKMSVRGVEYWFHSREPSILEKACAMAAQL